LGSAGQARGGDRCRPPDCGRTGDQCGTCRSRAPGDHPGHRARRQIHGALLPDERLERRAVERFRTPTRAGGEFGQRAQIPAVAFERVIGKPPLDAQVIEVGVDHHSRYDSIRGSFARVR
jgi:hypothetical protein